MHEMYAPSQEAVLDVKAWLIHSGIDSNSIIHSENKGWLALDLPAWQAESLFQTQYHEYDHAKSPGERVKVGCDEYHVPANLRHHIDYITPGVALSPSMIKSSLDVRKKRSLDVGKLVDKLISVLSKITRSPWAMPDAAKSLPLELQTCGRNITPACIRALYGLPGPQGLRNDSVNSLGIFQSGVEYHQQDLDLFHAKNALNVPQGTKPVLASINGGTAPSQPGDGTNYQEANIDISIAQALVYPQSITLYQVSNEVALEQSQLGFNTFLDALDGSYCNYTAYGLTGDDPNFDPTYPDPAPGGYKGQRMCGTYKPTKVISLSYGYEEDYWPLNYTLRQCNEFAKLGVQGVTIVFASGDWGVAGEPGGDSETGCLGANQTIYNPEFPSCPFITSVGATRLWDNQTIYDRESSMEGPELGPGYSSGGGFSNYFPRPSYQASAVDTYFKRYDPGHAYYTAKLDSMGVANLGANGGLYNRAGRGMPDVAANGANFLTFFNGEEIGAFGTSVAAPLFGSIITLINEERTAIGKGSVGFLNPTLYKHPEVFNDIVNGTNANCGSSGFQAVSGWDPVTGKCIEVKF